MHGPQHTFSKFVSILIKCVGKIFWLNVIGKSGVFITKNEMQNYISIQSRRNQTFTASADGSWGSWELHVMVEVRLKKLYKICTDDYDNNEYLAVKYIRFFTNDIVCL